MRELVNKYHTAHGSEDDPIIAKTNEPQPESEEPKKKTFMDKVADFFTNAWTSYKENITSLIEDIVTDEAKKRVIGAFLITIVSAVILSLVLLVVYVIFSLIKLARSNAKTKAILIKEGTKKLEQLQKQQAKAKLPISLPPRLPPTLVKAPSTLPKLPPTPPTLPKITLVPSPPPVPISTPAVMPPKLPVLPPKMPVPTPKPTRVTVEYPPTFKASNIKDRIMNRNLMNTARNTFREMNSRGLLVNDMGQNMTQREFIKLYMDLFGRK